MGPPVFKAGASLATPLFSISAGSAQVHHATVRPPEANLGLNLPGGRAPGPGGRMCGSHIPAGSTCDRYRVTRDDAIGHRSFTIRKHGHRNAQGSMILTSGGVRPAGQHARAGSGHRDGPRRRPAACRNRRQTPARACSRKVWAVFGQEQAHNQRDRASLIQTNGSQSDSIRSGDALEVRT